MANCPFTKHHPLAKDCNNSWWNHFHLQPLPTCSCRPHCSRPLLVSAHMTTYPISTCWSMLFFSRFVLSFSPGLTGTRIILSDLSEKKNNWRIQVKGGDLPNEQDDMSNPAEADIEPWQWLTPNPSAVSYIIPLIFRAWWANMGNYESAGLI